MQQYFVLPGLSFNDMCMGALWMCPSYLPEALRILQNRVGFEEGECIVLRVGAFPFWFGLPEGACSWQIIDAKTGVVAEGELPIDKALEMATLPSAAGTRLEPLLKAENNLEK